MTAAPRELPVAARLGAFGVVLAVAFAAAFGVGALTDDGSEAVAAAPALPHSTTVAEPLPGLAVTSRGYTLSPAVQALPTGRARDYRFTITGPDGTPVQDYERRHEQDLHLIVVRRDFSSYQHVHPVLDGSGTWSTPLDLEAGTYRVYADFTPTGGPSLVLGTDLFVAGQAALQPLPAPSSISQVDGFEIEMSGTPVAGQEAALTFRVSRDGVPVSELEPYLGAYGHLVSLRAGDLAYLHTHPTVDAVQGAAGGPDITFGTTFPSAGKYRLFLDFSVGGTVRTAEFTVDLKTGPTTTTPPEGGQDDHGHTDVSPH